MPAAVELANAIRALSMDAVQAANSGHPGAPMGMADIAQVLWCNFLNHNPKNPNWPNRDRFVLSNGHASMLIYSLLHLSGYDLDINEIKNFRQLHSKTPGHPEFGMTPGIETTTGPLGQGLAMAVGMAIAEQSLSGRFNEPDAVIVDHHTYVMVGDGCLMEGISHEACSLAGVLGLGKLIALYDDNGISIDGEVEGWFKDDTPKRFEAYGWHVIPAVDGHNAADINAAIALAKENTDRPSLICCKTVIGKGAPNMQGTSDVHGKALGDAEIAAVREAINWPHPAFEIPADIKTAWDATAFGSKKEAGWQSVFDDYQSKYPEKAALFMRTVQGGLPADWEQTCSAMFESLSSMEKPLATRKASEHCLQILGPNVPELVGGSADLTGSNNTLWKGAGDLAQDPHGRYLYYGVREFGMAAIMNGMAVHSGVIPFGGTFLVFMDYARNAVRLSALMKQRVIYVFTHDSIGLGEDGPTHQPVEHLAAMRVLPNLETWRPADAVETAMAWKQAIENASTPSALILSRQNLPLLPKNEQQVEDIAKGAYILSETHADEVPELILMATGSETHLLLEAATILGEKGKRVRVVSMPCTERFDAQSCEYKELVLPKAVRARVSVEAAQTDFWRKYVGLDGTAIGLDTFGESAPADQLYKMFGITVEAIVESGLALI